MNAYTAIMKAADSIERSPELFDFGSVKSPDPECGTPGCALGWIYFHLEGQKFNYFDWCGQHKTMYELLRIKAGTCEFPELDEFDPDWRKSAPACAAALRAYGKKYHAPKDAIPASVRAIFATEEAA